MTKLKNQILQIIAKGAAKKVSVLSSQFIRAAPQEKEAVLAGLDFERWLMETCQECLYRP